MKMSNVTPMIPVTRPSMPEQEEFEREIRGLWRTRRLTSYGEESRKLEERICWEISAASPVYLTGSGDMALYLAIQAVLGQNFLKVVQSGNYPEIITTPFTFLSTVGAIIRCNFRPVFADIDPVTFCLDPADILRHITSNTVAILPVHVFGNVCDDAAIEEIAAAHHLKVIYDAAHAFGEKLVYYPAKQIPGGKPSEYHREEWEENFREYDGRKESTEKGYKEGKLKEEKEKEKVRKEGKRSGERYWISAGSVLTLGDVSCCSLNATKVFHSAEGGLAVFRDPVAGERFRELTNFGLIHKEDAKQIGCNGKQDELRAALGLCNLNHLYEGIHKRRLIAERYLERLRGIRRVKCCLSGNRLYTDKNAIGQDLGPAFESSSGTKWKDTEDRISREQETGTTSGTAGRDVGSIRGGTFQLMRNYSYFPICVPERDRLCRELNRRGIFPRKYFYPLVSEMTAFRNLLGCDPSDTPIALEASRRILTLPIYEDLPLYEVDRICDVIEAVL